VFAAYGLLLVVGAIWHLTPLGDAVPDVVALAAVYLGLTARRQLAPAMCGAVVLGYLADLVVGSPPGLLSLTAGVVCAGGHLVQGGLLVRGRRCTAAFSLGAAVFAGLFVIAARSATGLLHGSVAGELRGLAAGALVTAIAGPLLFRFFRLVDARFARTQRE